jgi:hypothetical protein
MDNDGLIQELSDLQNPEVPADTTHVVWIYTGDKAAMLFRSSDGIMLGMQKQETVVFGENKNRGQSRVFIDRQSAEKWLKRLAAFDLQAQAHKTTVEDEISKPLEAEYLAMAKVVDFVKDALVQLAEGSIDIPSGGIHPLRNRPTSQKLTN